jgi:hypothetical protein
MTTGKVAAISLQPSASIQEKTAKIKKIILHFLSGTSRPLM